MRNKQSLGLYRDGYANSSLKWEHVSSISIQLQRLCRWLHEELRSKASSALDHYWIWWHSEYSKRLHFCTIYIHLSNGQLSYRTSNKLSRGLAATSCFLMDCKIHGAEAGLSNKHTNKLLSFFQLVYNILKLISFAVCWRTYLQALWL